MKLKGLGGIWTRDAKNVAIWMAAVEAEGLRITNSTVVVDAR